MIRMVYIYDKNIMGEIISEGRYGSYVKYTEGGFEVTEFLTDEDYRELTYFDDEDN